MEDFEYINNELGTDFKGNDEINWVNLSSDYTLSEKFIDKFQNKLNWYWLSCSQPLSEEFIERNQDVINWDNVSKHQILSEPFIEKYKDSVDWYNISAYQKLSEEFIEKFQNKVDWDYIATYQKLSEEFIEKFQNKVDWDYISVYQKLSEEFIEKFQDKVYWNNISMYQKLSENFIERNLKYLNLGLCVSFQKLSDEFIKRHNLIVNKDDLWQYKDTEFKKQELIKTEKYECHEDYFIAYKAIRKDRYSLYNFQCQYLPGETYESSCDCTDNEDSFGLNVGTYDFAKKFLNFKPGLIVKCKIYYKDIGRIVKKENKIRCFKITVLDNNSFRLI